jgi:hypothetical protein
MDMQAPKNQPKLASSDDVSFAIGSKPKRKASDRLVSAIVPVKGDSIGTGLLKLLRALLSLMLAVFFTLFVSWIILVSTIAATPKLGDNYLFVDRNSWGLGSAKEGSVGYATSQNSFGLLDKLAYHITGSINNGSSVEIVAGPLDVISYNTEGTLTINGVPTIYQSDKNIDRKQLGDSYIVICLEGSCGIPGTLLEVPIQDVIGEITGIIKISGLDPYER